jgi:hypothetical protein
MPTTGSERDDGEERKEAEPDQARLRGPRDASLPDRVFARRRLLALLD